MSEVETPTLGATALRLTIPVNPELDLATIPIAEFEYANPVTLNNLLILYGNANIELAEKLDRAGKRLEAAKLGKRNAERQLEDYETRLMRKYPPPRGVTTLKLVAAHLDRVAFDDETADQYTELRETVRKAEDAVSAAERTIASLKTWGDAIEVASNNITVHLSYVKAEWQHAGRR